MAQPPLSRQIRQFEEEVGVALFDRVGRGLRLTEAGRFLLEQSLQLTQRLEETLESTRRIGRNEKRWFGIGFVPSVLYGVLPELIRELRGDDSQVEVGLTEMITVQQLEALKSGRIDLAFGRLTFNDPAIVQQVVMAESLVAAIPGTAPTPTAPFDADALARQPLILYPARPRPSYADHVLSLFRGQGLQPRVVQEANELQTALGLVFDPRYRDFTFAPLTAAAVPYAVVSALARRGAGRRGLAETVGAVTLSGSAVYIAFNESFANWQAIWFAATLIVLAVTLARLQDAQSTG